MTLARRLSRLVACLGAAGVVFALTAGPAAAVSVPADPYADASIGFCDQHGHQVRSGSLGVAPFVWRAVSTADAPSGYAVKDGGRATLDAYQPRQDVDPVDWSGKQMTAASVYANNAAPTSAGTPYDPALVDFTATFPPQMNGLVELRLFFTAPNKPERGTPYPATFVQVTGNRWHQVGNVSVKCADAKAVSVETTVLPSATRTAPVRSTPSAMPSANSGDSKSRGRGAGSSSSAGSTASSSGAQAKSSAASPIAPTASAPTSADPSAVAGQQQSDNGLSGWWWITGIAIVAAIAAALVGRRMRRAP